MVVKQLPVFVLGFSWITEDCVWLIRRPKRCLRGTQQTVWMDSGTAGSANTLAWVRGMKAVTFMF